MANWSGLSLLIVFYFIACGITNEIDPNAFVLLAIIGAAACVVS